MRHDLLIGTYTRHDAEGIYWGSFDDASGAFELRDLAIASSNPAFLARAGANVYAVNERREGGVSAFAVRGGALELINERSTDGSLPCHLAATEHWVGVANYGSGSLAVFPRTPDGALGARAGFVEHAGSGPVASRQERGHAHQVFVTPSREVLVPDLGADTVYRYRIATDGTMEDDVVRSVLAPGAGPRHLAMHPTLALIYVINELDNTVTVLEWHADAPMRERQTVATLPCEFTGPSTTAEIAISEEGRYLHCTNRGHESLVTFAVGKDGELSDPTWVSTLGAHPRYFCFGPTQGHAEDWLLIANQDSDNVVVYRMEAGRPVEVVNDTPVPTPVCLLFV